jgi:hypothetical protein
MPGPLGDFVGAIKTGLEATEKAVGDIKTVVNNLNQPRSVLLTFANNTSKQLQLSGSDHAHGGFSVSPQGIINPRDSAVFGSQSKAGSIGTGTEGSVSYQCDGLIVTCHWDNPFIGENSCSISRDGPNHNKFYAVATNGVGNEKAPMRYDLFEIEMKGFDVFGAILDKWAEMHWGAGPLGFPTSHELPTVDNIGRFRNFERGIISWHPEIGPHIVWGLIGERWLQIGREQFGYPITDEMTAPDGRGKFNHFRAVQLPGKPEASIYWSPESGAHEIFGAIRDKWASMGWETSQLGYPISSEQDHNGGRIQQFQRGSLFWTPQGGVVIQ